MTNPEMGAPPPEQIEPEQKPKKVDAAQEVGIENMSAGDGSQEAIVSEQESFRRKIESIISDSRAILLIGKDRETRRLTPLYHVDASDPYMKEIIPKPLDRGVELSLGNIHKGEDGLLSLYVEVADQIAKARKSGAVKEDTDSLLKVITTLGRGQILLEKIMRERPQDIKSILKKILIKCRGIPEEKITPEQLEELKNSISRSKTAVKMKKETLERYLRK